MEDKKEKILELSEKIMSLLPLIDTFMNSIDKEDFELLEECRETLKDRINTNNSALPIIMACGGNYNDIEDTMKVRTLDCLIDLINIRKEYREAIIKNQETQKNKQEVLKLFGIMGM